MFIFWSNDQKEDNYKQHNWTSNIKSLNSNTKLNKIQIIFLLNFVDINYKCVHILNKLLTN